MPKTIVLPASNDFWDSTNGQFVSVKEQKLIIEHSLISLSKWESIWKKPFLSEVEKTPEEWLSYVKCMTLNQVPEDVYSRLTTLDMEEIFSYIQDPMTATTFSDLDKNVGRKEIITNELLYFSMFQYNIPIELEKWHLNRLITLIHVFAIKSNGEKKMSSAEAARYQRAINESRRHKKPRR